MKLAWRTLSEKPIANIQEWVREATKNGQELNIGTDSLQSGRNTQFSTVIVILTPGKGGRAAYCREVVPKIKSLRERLLREVWNSLEVALELSDLVNGDLTVHVDANPDQKHMSSRYIQELTGAVVSQGFRVKIKPDAWAASHVGDWIVRHMGQEKTA
jgi:predicted RNase H-related nuclease YkuK (DUF458 family)